MARSNRQLTQFAIQSVQSLIKTGPRPGIFSAGNTEVKADYCGDCNRPAHIVCELFGKEILRLYMSPLNPHRVVGMMISSGDFYDSKGRPSRTTRERLNGLLDFLSTAGYLPDGVRCFLKEDGQCAVGKGESSTVLSSETPRILLMANPIDLIYS